jgi:hypothetical protein
MNHWNILDSQRSGVSFEWKSRKLFPICRFLGGFLLRMRVHIWLLVETSHKRLRCFLIFSVNWIDLKRDKDTIMSQLASVFRYPFWFQARGTRELEQEARGEKIRWCSVIAWLQEWNHPFDLTRHYWFWIKQRSVSVSERVKLSCRGFGCSMCSDDDDLSAWSFRALAPKTSGSLIYQN